MLKTVAVLLFCLMCGCSLNSPRQENIEGSSLKKPCNCPGMEKCQLSENPKTGQMEMCCSPESCSCPSLKDISKR